MLCYRHDLHTFPREQKYGIEHVYLSRVMLQEYSTTSIGSSYYCVTSLTRKRLDPTATGYAIRRDPCLHSTPMRLGLGWLGDETPLRPKTRRHDSSDGSTVIVASQSKVQQASPSPTTARLAPMMRQAHPFLRFTFAVAQVAHR